MIKVFASIPCVFLTMSFLKSHVASRRRPIICTSIKEDGIQMKIRSALPYMPP